MIIGLLKEITGENRVALLPEGVAALVKMNVTVLVENGAGESSFASDSDYEKAGARIESRARVIASSDLVLQIKPAWQRGTQSA